MKVFGIGMFKTGTTSLGRCFEILGYKTLHGPWWPEDIMIKDPWYKQPLKWSKHYQNIKNIIKQYDAFQDYPWMFLFKETDFWFPNSKFILTTRKADKVASSDINMWKRMRKVSIPPKKQFIERYNKHYSSVLDYFKKKNNLLIVNFEKGDGWKEICQFLEKPIPDQPFPHLNKGLYV
jgi:hypothetical protein